ncbi:MAG TPA: class II aldolase/adducin family protein [Xanthobacteraceae bacterium]|jgi:ribulose-5-phosphate 4-epimerase/fuculose-1-phosphate aldolase|nr:class II aldolase/adducin family protein [Xanthobacteraceae bacterium]
MSVSEEKLRGQLVDCTRMMVMAELLDYSGHVSARLPSTDRFLIPARDSSRAGIKADDILIVDLNGKVLEGEGPCPAETQIHAGVYRARDDVQVVGHGHPPMSTLFTMVDRPMVAVRNYGYRFIGTPVHPDPTHIRTAAQGDAVARTLGKCSCCLLRGHGSVVAANSVAEVFLDSLEMEENARSTVYAASLGTIKPITPQEAELLKASFAKNDFRAGKVWDHYKEKAKIAGLL